MTVIIPEKWTWKIACKLSAILSPAKCINMFIHLLGISIGDIIIGGNVVVGGDETEGDEVVGLIVGLVMGTAVVGTWGFSEAMFIPLYAYALLSKCAIGSPPVSISLVEISEIKSSIGLNVTNTYDNNEKYSLPSATGSNLIHYQV